MIFLKNCIFKYGKSALEPLLVPFKVSQMSNSEGLGTKNILVGDLSKLNPEKYCIDIEESNLNSNSIFFFNLVQQGETDLCPELTNDEMMDVELLGVGYYVEEGNKYYLFF